MHELTIAMEIVEIAKEYADKANSSAVREIEIEVGEMSGVMIDSLEFALDIAYKNTILENTKTTILRIQGKARCNSCKAEFDLNDLYTFCPECSKYDYQIISGKELRVKSIIID